MYNESRSSSYSSDSYQRYVSNPSNRHDDSKLEEKFGTANPNLEADMNGGGSGTYEKDAYRFTRSTANPYRKPTSIDRLKLQDIRNRSVSSVHKIHTSTNGTKMKH